MDGRKGKRKKEHDEAKESSRESTGSTAAKMAAGARGGGVDGGASAGASPTQGSPGQNTPRSAAPAAKEQRGRSSPTVQLPAAAPGASAPGRHGVRSPRVLGQAQSSGNMPSPATAAITAATAAGARGGDTSADASGAPPTPGNRGQNAPRSAAPVADEPRGRSWTKADLRAAALGRSAPSDPGVQGQAQGSGTSSPLAKVCPVCHHSVFSNNTICVNCACVSAQKLVFATRPPPPPQPQQQQRPDGLQGRLSPAYMEFVANRLMGQPRGTAPQNRAPPPVPAISIPPLPQPQDQRPPRPQQHDPRPPQPVASGVQLQHQRLRRMAAEQAATRRAGAPVAKAPPAAQFLLPGVQWLPPKAQPVPRADKPVGFHYNPVVLGPGPDPEDGWCPACRYYPARTVLQPRRHDCVCETCRDVDRIVCPVCGSK
ncbi:unnamed protein product [Urochloa humidicola]